MQTQNQKKILFIATFLTPFIQEDIDTLSKHALVRPVIGSGLRQVWRIFTGLLGSDIVFCWFASTYAGWAVFLARVMGKRSYIVLGGVDVAADESIGYGIWLSPWKSSIVRFVLRNATRILAVDASLRSKAVLRAEYDGGNIDVVPTGYDATFWKSDPPKEQFVLTVAVVHDLSRVKVKGIDLLVEAARSLPNIPFVVVGLDPALIPSLQPPPNVAFQEPIRREQLLPLYQRARVYCQPSRHEGLPNTLCEAMLCECIPVVTDAGGMRSLVVGVGLVAEAADAATLAENIAVACKTTSKMGSSARQRIVERLPRSARERALTTLLFAEPGAGEDR